MGFKMIGVKLNKPAVVVQRLIDIPQLGIDQSAIEEQIWPCRRFASRTVKKIQSLGMTLLLVTQHAKQGQTQGIITLFNKLF